MNAQMGMHTVLQPTPILEGNWIRVFGFGAVVRGTTPDGYPGARRRFSATNSA
jgi:hypothetical protein